MSIKSPSRLLCVSNTINDLSVQVYLCHGSKISQTVILSHLWFDKVALSVTCSQSILFPEHLSHKASYMLFFRVCHFQSLMLSMGQSSQSAWVIWHLLTSSFRVSHDRSALKLTPTGLSRHCTCCQQTIYWCTHLYESYFSNCHFGPLT